ncbi:MAG: ATP-binding cassette domain-containing protein, partial [Cetobacterium sp.]
MSYLKIKNIEKTFGKFKALNNIDFEIERGEFICFLGPSGCGKTTLLRIIAGLETVDSG